MQLLPVVSQVLDSPQMSLQQSSFAAQASPTTAHRASSVHTPPEQLRLQQSTAMTQGSPSPTQPPPSTQTLVPVAVGSHRPEQHSEEATHSSPSTLHMPVGGMHT
jgi:hypothetical protein